MIAITTLWFTVLASVGGLQPEELEKYWYHITPRIEGQATGGTLIFVHSTIDGAILTGIRTSANEPAENVTSRLNRLLDRLNFGFSTVIVGENPTMEASRWPLHTLHLTVFPGIVLSAGTEVGLGIPSVPLFLTAREVDSEGAARVVRLEWEHPEGQFDVVYPTYGSIAHICNKDTTIHCFELPPSLPESHVVSVSVLHNGIPSNACRVSLSRGSLCDAFDHPFTGGIASGWKAWWDAGALCVPAFEQGATSDYLGYGAEGMTEPYVGKLSHDINECIDRKARWKGRFYQVMSSSGVRACGGIYRKYLGLSPGGKYRVNIATKVHCPDEAEGKWAFTMHACALPSGLPGLTNGQLAGTEALPDGTFGPEAGLFACYSQSNCSAEAKGATDEKEPLVGSIADGNNTGTVFLPTRRSDPDIRTDSHILEMPDDSQTIVLWLRLYADFHSPPQRPLTVEMHSVSFEDLEIVAGDR